VERNIAPFFLSRIGDDRKIRRPHFNPLLLTGKTEHRAKNHTGNDEAGS
jgi:hypothetical protein